MQENPCWIDTRHVDFDPRFSRRVADPIELFAFVSSEMHTMAENVPLLVRFDATSAKYLVLCNGVAYTREGMPLEAARKIGLSRVPCRVVGDGPHAAQSSERPSPGNAPTAPDFRTDPRCSAVDLNPLFEEVLAAVLLMARTVCGRTRRDVLRMADGDDWLQEGLIALWRKLRQEKSGFHNGDDVRRFVYTILRNQAARAANRAARSVPISEEDLGVGRSVLDEIIAASEDRRLQKAAGKVQALIERADKALVDALAGMSASEAAAVRTWLEGAGYRTAGKAWGLSLAQVRRLALQLREEPLASLVRKARRNLKAIYLVCPAAACQINMGRLRRLLAGQ
jgi:RNA polymerase sigma factor (sigma-70 family)